LGALTETWLIWYGVMFMVIVMFKPEGIAGMLQDLEARLRGLLGAGRPASPGAARADDGPV
jgi:branched-chain amino acid transport system permease protein